MKTTTRLFFCASAALLFGCLSASAETIYYSTKGNLLHFDDNADGLSQFVNENGDRLNYDSINWSEADLIVDGKKTALDNTTGILNDFTVRNFTVQNFDGSPHGHFWWQQDDAGKGHTINVLQDFNVYSSWRHDAAKGLSLKIGRNFNVHVDNASTSHRFDFRGGETFSVGGDFTVTKMAGPDDEVNIMDFYKKDEAGDFVGGGFFVGGNFNVTDFGRIHAWGNSVLRVEKDFTATGGTYINMDRQGSLYIGGNFSASNMGSVTFNSIGRNNEKYSGDLEIMGDVTLTNLSDADKIGFRTNDSAKVIIHGAVNSTGGGSVRFENVGNVSGVTGAAVDLKKGLSVKDNGYLSFYLTSHAKVGGDVSIDGTFNASRMQSMNIAGNMTATGSSFDVRETGYFHVGKDMSFGPGVHAKISAYKGADGSAASVDNAGFVVDGRIKMDNSTLGVWFYNERDGVRYANDLYVKAGGIDGTGSIYVTNESGLAAEDYSLTYILDCAGNSSFTGGVFQYKSGAESSSPTLADRENWDKMKLNIIKNGAGTQAIIANGYSMWRGTVTVNEGGMKLFTANNDLVKVDLILNHGTSLEVAYENPGVHNPSAENMGYIRAGKVEINGDARILFDVSAHPDGGYESDWIKADEVTGSGVATLIIDLDENYFMVDQPVENLELKIFEIENNNYDWAQAIIKIMYKGGDISSNFEKLAYYSEEKENGVYVVLNGIVIPEPAAMAAIFGAIALAFASYRRGR